MGTIAVKMKIMPDSPSSNLKDIENKIKILVEKHGGINPHFLEEPIAFGLKAVFASFEWSEEKELDELEEKMGKIADVKSAEVSDIRRAIG